MSMGAELPIVATADTAQAEARLAALERRIASAEKATRGATAAAKDWNKEMGDALRKGGQMTGGAAGGAMGRMGAGLAGNGVMDRLMAAAAAATIVYQVVKRFTDLEEESARRRLRYAEQFSEAAKSAEQSMVSTAKDGLSQEQGYRQAMAAGGASAIAQADELISMGVDKSEAYQVAATLGKAGLSHGLNGSSLGDVLKVVAARGGNVTQAADIIAQQPWLLGADSLDSANQVAAMMGDDPISAGRLSEILNDKYLQGGQAYRENKGSLDLSRRRAATENMGAVFDSQQKELDLINDPQRVFYQAALDNMQKEIAHLASLAKDQSMVSKLIADVFRPEGSFETQMARMIRDQTRAIYPAAE